MTSMQEGIYSKMIDNVVSFYTGYIQVHHPEYWDDKTIENTFVPPGDVEFILERDKNISGIVPRLESFTLLSYGENTKGAALIGIDPERENKMTGLKKWIKEGEYLKNGDDGILLAVNLAENIGVKIGDTLVLISQGYHGMSAAGLFPVRGILKFPSPQLNNLGGYVDIKAAQNFFSSPDRLTSLVMMVNDYTEVSQTRQRLQEAIGDELKLKTWEEIDPWTKNMIDADRAQAVITKGILYLIVGFGIFGTIIMMIAERRKEMGIMVALGMQRYKLSKILFYETLMIGFLGVIVGFIGSIPLINYFVHNPIPITGQTAEAYEQFGFEPVMYFSNELIVYLRQVLIIFIISVLIYIYPLVKILRLKVTKALHA
jgi:ABC-type lipoprotein release transport system permease subunit